MRLIFCVLILTLTFCFSGPAIALDDSYLQCLVIGQEGDPSKARVLLRDALNSWYRGKRSEAIELYEQAVIADHSVLRHEDHGLAMALLDKYRAIDAPQTTTALCRRGFFENILIGNLEESIKFYEKAAEAAQIPENSQLARDEADRLRDQLKYITEWQQTIIRANKTARDRDLQEYLQRTKMEELQSQSEDNAGEIEELQERLSFLQKQEKETMEDMYSSIRSAARNRRRYYYPGAFNPGAPDPSATTFPEGNTGIDNSANQGQVANPYASQPVYGVSGDVAMNRFYVYRGRARRQEDQLAQIRAEITGLQRRVAQLQKTNKDLREKASASAVRSAP
ncbi:MAG: hypothetical protein KKB51_06040 [Candidatus Riflebacteria bacterium]|nr:hypothetical protein [Candidatus Riflebacteria bacterium]